ncbi:MAG: hypothetical protein P8182_16900 [Deltaproteobacteria bacterium]
MGRIFTITAAILLMTVSWVGAGTFSVLADAGAVKTPTPLYVGPGMVVKAEFKSNLNQDAELQAQSDALFPVETPAQAGPKVTPKPAVTFKERGTRAMAPPPAATPVRKPGLDTVAQAKEQKDSLELDLEKDLVISPPPAKGGGKSDVGVRPTVETRGARQGAIKEKKVHKAKATRRVKRTSPSRRAHYAASRRAIRKVRPISRHAWSLPAGNYRARGCPISPDSIDARAFPRRVAQPPTARSYVRDGVMVKLAPRTVPAAYDGYPEDGEFVGSEILSVATEIIGMPFAFISSLF